MPLSALDRAGTAGRDPQDQDTADQISVSSVLRILAGHPVKPWQYRSWISPRDPDFAAKATVILDLYQGYWQGQRLRPGDRILSVDAKPSIQARGRCRRHAGHARQARARRARIRPARRPRLPRRLRCPPRRAFGGCEPTTGVNRSPRSSTGRERRAVYASARRAFWIVDNGASHRNWAAAAPARRRLPERADGPPPGPRILAQPGPR